MKIKIADLYYDLLNLYGEQGNVLALEKAFKNQDIETVIDLISIDDKKDFNKYDIVYIGSGSEENLKLALNDLKKEANKINVRVQ